MTEELNRFGIEYTFASCDPKSFQESIKENTKLIFIETPTNPLLSITDINAVANIGRVTQTGPQGELVWRGSS